MTYDPAAVDAWFRAHDAYHRASDEYNARLALVRAERERGNWSINTDPEYQALTLAQKDAFAASEGLYQHIRTRAAAYKELRAVGEEQSR